MFNQVRILSELPPVEVKSTGFRIFPYLGLINSQDWVVDEREVAEVIDIELEPLASSSMYGEEVVHYDHWPAPRLIAFYKIGGLKLWGASFKIIQPLVPRILAEEWQV